MGLLDDAIREHLDLKRRRGADPAEIERAEREALGPVRRNREPGLSDEELAADDDAFATDEHFADEDSAFDPLVGSARDEPDDGAAVDLAEEDDEDPFGLDDDEPEGPYAEDDAADAVAADEDPHRTQLMSTVDIPVPDDATAEYDVEEAFAEEPPPARDLAAAEGEDDEDVLEETPEFLQDTPDHDRLWFEQRPPRDFDFDG